MEIADLLQCALQVIGRVSIPPDKVREIVGSGKKQLSAFNLCDGVNTVIEIAKKSRMDQGNLSRTLNRWKTHGILFSVGSGRDLRFLHIYPLPKSDGRTARNR